MARRAEPFHLEITPLLTSGKLSGCETHTANYTNNATQAGGRQITANWQRDSPRRSWKSNQASAEDGYSAMKWKNQDYLVLPTWLLLPTTPDGSGKRILKEANPLCHGLTSLLNSLTSPLPHSGAPAIFTCCLRVSKYFNFLPQSPKPPPSSIRSLLSLFPYREGLLWQHQSGPGLGPEPVVNAKTQPSRIGSNKGSL